VSYDVLAWPVDRAMTPEEAIAEIQERSGHWRIGLGRDRRLNAFVKAIDGRLPGLGTERSEYPMEFDVHRNWVFMALPWSYVREVIDVIAPIAFAEGIALYDPQRNLVALPRPFGEAPLGTAGTEEHERNAQRMLGIIASGGPLTADGDPSEGIGDELRAAGITVMSPLGFEITADVEADVRADPTRVPASLQTPERRDLAIAHLSDPRPATRHQALALLGGWDPEPEVRSALLPLLEADDVMVVGLAANALARQGDVTDLQALLAAVHRLSPADGGTLDAMLRALPAALELASAAGPDALAAARSTVRPWRERPPGIRGRREPALEAELDRLLE
jgi:HEAT repeats